MKIGKLMLTLGMVAISTVPLQQSLAEDASAKPTSAEKAFITKAADGGMTEVELGQLAVKKGGSDEVKNFGSKMVKDHGKINDDLKQVAGKMNVEVPAKISAKHHALIEKISGMSGADFDRAYVKEMVKDHEMDIAEFEKAQKEVKNEDLKEFIDDSLTVMKDHLEMIKKFDQAKS